MTSFDDFNLIEEKELIPGFFGRMKHTGKMTIVKWKVKKGAVLPPHSHPHVQVTMVLEGEFQMTVNDESKNLHPGEIVSIDGEVVHAGKALTDCLLIDVFHPEREEYK